MLCIIPNTFISYEQNFIYTLLSIINNNQSVKSRFLKCCQKQARLQVRNDKLNINMKKEIITPQFGNFFGKIGQNSFEFI